MVDAHRSRRRFPEEMPMTAHVHTDPKIDFADNPIMVQGVTSWRG